MFGSGFPAPQTSQMKKPASLSSKQSSSSAGGVGVGVTSSDGSRGSVSPATSSPSLLPPPSVSASSGSVRWTMSSRPSASPSSSLSASFGSVPTTTSSSSDTPSESASVLL